jgi:hypothetical protein
MNEISGVIFTGNGFCSCKGNNFSHIFQIPPIKISYNIHAGLFKSNLIQDEASSAEKMLACA